MMSSLIVALMFVPLGCLGHADPRQPQIDNCTGHDRFGWKPPIQSYHFHVLFWPNNTNAHKAMQVSADNAMKLRQTFFEEFGLGDDDECQVMFGGADLCWFPVDWEPGVGLAAPFVVPNWPIYVPLDRFTEVMPWISQHRGDLDVLMHPNSGCMRDDHEFSAMWSGNKWEINLDALGGPDMPTAAKHAVV